MKSAVSILGIVPLLCAFVSLDVWAQATAQISGSVRDQSGAVLPGVEVTATQTNTGIARSTVTNETGTYVLANLPLGPYKLEAALPGFRTFVQTGIVLQVNSSPVINPVLEVGQVSEQVEVQANAALVETASVGIGQVIEQQRILELPLNGRQVTDLITLSGAAVTTNVSTGRLFNDLPYISVGGGVPFGVDYSLDGANHMNFLIGTTMPMPFPDATQEFKVESTGLSAQRGNSAAVAVVTKSGANDIHGDLFEFVRNDLFNATEYFAGIDPKTGDKVKSTLKRNQFGGTIGGPIVKNKLFFFAGYQRTMLRQDPANVQQFIPTPAMLAGDWTAFTSAACNAGVARTLRPPFNNNRIGPDQYSKVAVFIANKILASQPAPPNECGLVTVGAPVQRNDNVYVGKLDYQKGPKHSLFGRILLNSQFQPDSSKLTTNLLPAVQGTDALASSYAFGDTYLIGTNTVQAFRLATNRVANHQYAKQFFSVCDAGATDIYCGYTPNWISGWTLNGGFSGLGIQVPSGTYWIPTQYQLNDDVSTVKGSHQLAFGVGAIYGRVNQRANFLSGGAFTFNGSTTGLGMGDFMLGRVFTFQQGTPNKLEIHEKRFNLYITDNWKVRPRLTANYGLRWEPFFPQLVPDQGSVPGPVYNFNHDRFLQGIKSTVFTNAPAGFYYTSDPGFPARTGINTQWAHFAPRVGLAWDVKGDGKTSLRASYAFGYTFLSGIWREDSAGSIPWGGRVSVTNPPGGLDAPWRGLGNPFPYVLDKNAPFLPAGLFLTNKPDLTTPQTYSWNLSIQHQVGRDWLISASYLATRAMHIWTQNSINPAQFLGLDPCTINGVSYATCSTTTNTDARRILTLERPQDGAKIGPLAEFDDGGTSIYHAMLLSLQKRAARSITFTGNYTWSHCISPYADINSNGPPANETYTKPNDRNFDRGNCLSDRRHLFNFTGVAQTPNFSNHTLHLIGADWRLSAIYRWSSGAPLNIVSGTDQALTGTNLQRANQVQSNPYKDRSGRPYSQWVDPAAFLAPGLGTYGNVGWNSLVGPHTWQFDMALSRIFNVRESQRFEVRAEAFNVTNSFIPAGVSGTVTTGAITVGNSLALNNNTFGQIRTAQSPRIMQFALKYVF
jgi:Carboxypeptidase regulatory-like domain